jgi:4-hydroxybenzoate polyprenyltransferase
LTSIATPGSATPSRVQSDFSQLPLVVHLDGTLIRSDFLIENAFSCLGRNPLSAYKIGLALARGKASMKRHLVESVQVDPRALPYDERILAHINEARAKGRSVYLASTWNERRAAAVADHLGLFDGLFVSDHDTDLSGETTARKLTDKFGEQGFDYIGENSADLPVWRIARSVIPVKDPTQVKRALEDNGQNVKQIAIVREWLGLLRIHQYTKNVLIFVPMLTAHRLDLTSFLTGFHAFCAFCLCASSVYIVNDLVDVQSDRLHPTKRNRPLASGAIPPLPALLVAAALLVSAIGIALSVSVPFLAVLAIYFSLTTAYTLILKRKMIIDVIALAALYTIRVAAGAVALDIALSDWLLIFSGFFFTALALMKRYTELAMRLDRAMDDPVSRNYRRADLSIVAALSAASGMNAVTVFALYISSDTVQRLYGHPHALWLVCPLLMYWIGRALMMSHRRLMHDDPIVFALKDKVSLMTASAIGALMLIAMR